MPNRFLRINEVRKRVPISKAAIYQKIKEGNFPASIALGPRAVAWLESDIENWICERIGASTPAHDEVQQ